MQDGKPSANVHLYPFCTRPFDLKSVGELRPQWKERFLLNVTKEEILKDNVVILFEVMDWNLSTLSSCNHENLIPIAWGYVKPNGEATHHLGDNKLQLYRYTWSRPRNWVASHSDAIHQPDVWHSFNNPTRVKYDSYLEISIKNFQPKESIATSVYRPAFSSFEKEVNKREL